MEKRIRRICESLAILFLLLAIPARSQQVNAGIEDGFPPYGSFHGDSLEHVLLQSSSLHVDIPLISVQQRGGKSFAWRFMYDTPNYQLVFVPNPNPTPTNPGYYTVQAVHDDTGWRVTNPFHYEANHTTTNEACTSQISYNHTDNYFLTDPDGTKHQFALRTEYPTTCVGQQLSGPALDGSGIVWNIQTNIATLKDGTQVDLNGSPWFIRDSNGNEASPSADTLNRNLMSGPGTSSTWTIVDSNGTPQTFQLTSSTFTIQTNMCQDAPPTLACHEMTSTVSLPTTLTFPNSRSYVFSYQNNSYGQLTRIDLPTGGFITYTYGAWNGVVQPYTGRYGTSMGHTPIATRTLNRGGTATTWTYSGSVSGAIADPAGNEQVHSFQKICVNSVCSPSAVETTVKSYKGLATGGALLQTVQTDWTGEPNPSALVLNNSLVNLRSIRATTTLDNGLVKKTEIDFETFQYSFRGIAATAFRMNPTEKREFDYGTAGALLRKTDYQYLHSGNVTYTSLNIVDRPSSVITYDGNGIIKAQVSEEYDNYSVAITSSGAVQHDPSFNTSYTTRGNLTAIKRWRNTDGAWLPVTNSYDDAGNMLSTTDPLNHKTQFDYTDSWSNATCAASGQGKAYVTSITDALGHLSQLAHNSCTGSIASYKNQNDINAGRQGTSYTYDMFGRGTSVNYPDGGQTTTCYTDIGGATCTKSGPPFSVVKMELIVSGKTPFTTTTLFDGLGRVSQTQLNSDPAGVTYSDTVYDLRGNVKSRSNPYRTVSDLTYGLTTYGYDGLNRNTSVTAQDGSITTTSYSGNAITVTDPAGICRETFTDALGRLASAVENPCLLHSEPSYTTSYGYDVLDDLTSVLQNGSRQRTFNYNSLAQLLTAANPESGVTNYTYDANGNLQTKVSPLPNQTASATVTTTYAYDALNRLTSKNYSDGTPAATFTYDLSTAAGVNGLTNTVGRLVQASNSSAQTVTSYDPMGRITQQWQCTPINCGTQGWFTFAYGYDLAGEETTFAPGAFGCAANCSNGGFTLTQTYNAAGRPISLTSSLTDPPYHPPTLISGVAYNSAGQINSMTYGNNLTETRAYNNRLQPCHLNLNSSGGTLASCTSATPAGNIQDFVYHYNLNVADNGNITWTTGTGQQSFYRTYQYDSLNRLSTMADSDPSQVCRGLSWTYDPWGNRTAQILTAGACGTFSVAVNTKNQFVGAPYQYDAAGNMTHDASHSYTYDAEGHITKVDGGSTATYVYDANGRRVVQTTPNGGFWGFLQIHSWYDTSGRLRVIWNQAGSWGADSLYFGGEYMGYYSTEFVFKDILGSSRIATAVDKSLTDSVDYLPFGEQEIGSPFLPLKFTGKVRDIESSLDNFDFRYLSSSVGRFMSPDPLGGHISNPQSLNRYAYVLNNPLNFLDPFGLQGTCATMSSDSGELMGSSCGPIAPDLGSGLPDGMSVTSNLGGSQSGPAPPESDLPSELQGGTITTLPGSTGADATQAGLGLLGAIPGPIGTGANLINAGISLYRGNYGQAALNAAFAIPFVGSLGKVAQLGEGALEAAQGVEGIYEFIGSTGKIYVGQSGNIGLRLAQHLNSVALFPEGISSIRFTEIAGGRLAREVAEQFRINELGGLGNLQNVRNAIGAAREYLMVPFKF